MKNKARKIAIIGAGITGLVCAYLLEKKDYQVTVFEKEKIFGGLAGSTLINNIPIEKYYHHFFTSDRELIKIADELGIKNKIRFYPSSVSFYINKKLCPFTTPFDLLKFKALPFFERIKMGLVTLYFLRKKNWGDLDKYSCQEFFRRIKSDKLYQVIWKPLLKLKFGKYADDIPAAFLWGRIHPRGKSRRGAKEYLGYFNGGSDIIFNKLLKKIKTNTTIKQEQVIGFKKIKDKVEIQTKNNKYFFQSLIFTASNPLFINSYKEINLKLKNKLNSIKYQAINCIIFKLKKSLSPYYWLNVVDPKISFIGFIEHTNLVPKKFYKNHLAYVFNYLPSNDKIYNLSAQEVFKLYTKDIKKVFPKFSKNMVLGWQLFRDPYATPIYDKNYSSRIPPLKITNKIYLANTSQIYPEDRNINNSIVLAKKVIKYF